MASITKKLSIRTNFSSSTPKKYLGEPDDPHYVPNSPLIERQRLTEQEEVALKQSCTRVLAHVPHSDDMSDDPLKYIAAHIQEGKPSRPAPLPKRERNPEPVETVVSTETNNAPHSFLELYNDSATPSEISLRDTGATTDYSTPQTSAGLTPGDIARRHSDAARQSVTSTKKTGSCLRNEAAAASPKPKSHLPSYAPAHTSLDAAKPSTEADAVKHTLRLVSNEPTRVESSRIKSMDGPPLVRFSAPDLNKSLPPPPPPEYLPPVEETQPHIGRLMKTIRKKKSVIAEGRSFSTASAPPLPPGRGTDTATQNARTPAAAVDQTKSKEPPRIKFRLRLFSRKQRPADVLVT
jgi:hypothetical protein